MTEQDRTNLRARSEEAVGELAQALIDNPLVNEAVKRALGAGERAQEAQRSAMGALNFAAASDIERLEQRLRSMSGRLEDLEDRLDEIVDDVRALGKRLEAGAEKAADPT